MTLPFDDSNYVITRFLFQRLLACVYLIGFLVVVNQFLPLCGERGVTPSVLLMKRMGFWDGPSIFWLNSSDKAFLVCGWIGVLLSLIAVSGVSEAHGVYVSAAVWFLLWLLYLSYVNIGGTWYSFGWETLLLEAGFLAIFFGSSDTKVPVIIIWLLRWLLFRLMFGAGLIKIRGDECWRDLTCMIYHYETQPLPNPLSWYFHQLPVPIHKLGVLFNHFTELIVPFFYFVRGTLGAAAGLITMLFQFTLILSGNFSWLNWLTIVLCIPCFSDRFLSFIPLHLVESGAVYPVHHYAVYVLAAVILFLSIPPAMNLLSSHQIMNTSFEPFHLVNTYGAFGSITKVRREIVIEGTEDPEGKTGWKEYHFKGKPGDLNKTPPIVAPYHLRLDWLMWFAPFSSWRFNPWFISFLGKILEGDRTVLVLLKENPFPDNPPLFVRALFYEYHFTTAEEKRTTGAVWKRTELGLYCPVMSRDAAQAVLKDE